MPWSLAIHHIDVFGAGDATLIIAREDDAHGNILNFRSCLVDGGLNVYVANWIDYLQNELQGRQLDVMVCSHYDEDHLYGLSSLLTNAAQRLCDNTRIYDQGWPGGDRALDNGYINYLLAINGCVARGGRVTPVLNPLPNRTRVAIEVCSDIDPAYDTLIPPSISAYFRVGLELPALAPGEVTVPPPPPPGYPDPDAWNLYEQGQATKIDRRTSVGKIIDDPDTLRYTEILWAGMAMPAGAPTMTCIAVNRYVPGEDEPIAVSNSLQSIKNEKSLAFEIQFNNFKYYLGGDIETPQEDYIQDYLNQYDSVAGRVLAFKPSHHGANTATSRDFVTQIKPMAAFVSCGTDNQYGHPAIQTVNILDGYPAVPTWEEANPPAERDGIHTTPPPPPPNRPVAYYLTGYQTPGPPPVTRGGDASLTAGDPNANPVRRGHIVLRITEAQSQGDVAGQLGIGVGTAAQQAALALGAAQNVADKARDFTKEAVIGSGATVAAAAIAALLGVTVGVQGSAQNTRNVQTALKNALIAIGNLADQSTTDQTYLNDLQNTVVNALTPCAQISAAIAGAAGAAADTAARQAVVPGITAQALAQAVTNRVMAQVVPAAAAAGAAAGAALNGQNAVAAGAATQAAVLAAGGALPVATNASTLAANASQAAAAAGLFNVEFYNLFGNPVGNQIITHS
jgi:beta-lactamase superfamily II metal-dependent hydrolase